MVSRVSPPHPMKAGLDLTLLTLALQVEMRKNRFGKAAGEPRGAEAWRLGHGA